jgi:competence protein ComEC
MLISADARLIALRTPSGVFLQQAPGASKFTRDAWLQYWSAAQPLPIPVSGEAADGAVVCTEEECLLRPRPGVRAALLVRGAEHPQGCRSASVIVAAEPARGLCPKPWPQLVDRFTVWRYGSVAIWLGPRRAWILTDRTARGMRPWVPGPPVPRARPQTKLPQTAAEDAPR